MLLFDSLFSNFDGSKYQDFEFTGTMLTKYRGHDAEVVIPEGVTKIQGCAFFANKTLRRVYIPGSVKTLDGNIFLDCTNLEDVIIAEGISRVRSETFKGCKSLQKIDLPYSVKEISGWVFVGCSSLRVIRAPGATAISHTNFSGCKSLEAVYVSRYADLRLHPFPPQCDVYLV